ncbi:pentapeptide repeat-containing protein [Mesobacterium sp. TK19101]|uniref:Pentapeptide repeat-containing protein n=1 Tax=Mesobacterium hydrothermale TaxID=3111907 RepID=A0ABU6HH09_9RHOB|nr:pentapeptide repeat-containing protein [Mesobacterium sp. TK19101]MEC3861130.1 pentapeptide repeat-containing protein [Mesobacterium sp. TK19101]
MDATTVLHLTLPVSPAVVTFAAKAVGLLLALALVFGAINAVAMPAPKAARRSWIERLRAQVRLDDLPLFVFFLIFVLWAGIALVLLAGLYVLVWDVTLDTVPGRDDSGALWEFRFKLAQLAALTTVMGAVVALPITLNRVRLTREANDTARESLLNDKINVAAADLHAMRQVSEKVRRAGKVEWITRWQDDVIRRTAAIDRLERLANEEPKEAPAVARMLSVYVRELSREFPAKAVPEGADVDAPRAWAAALEPARSDMEKAAQTLGRLRDIPDVDVTRIEIDLRSANLQGFDLQHLNFEKARFEKAELQGANLGGAELQGADLGGAEFDPATNLRAALLRGAALRFVDFTAIPQIEAHVPDLFGDASVTLPGRATPDHPDWPAHWPRKELGWKDFDPQWRAWQRSIGMTPDGSKID